MSWRGPRGGHARVWLEVGAGEASGGDEAGRGGGATLRSAPSSLPAWCGFSRRMGVGSARSPCRIPASSRRAGPRGRFIRQPKNCRSASMSAVVIRCLSWRDAVRAATKRMGTAVPRGRVSARGPAADHGAGLGAGVSECVGEDLVVVERQPRRHVPYEHMTCRSGRACRAGCRSRRTGRPRELSITMGSPTDTASAWLGLWGTGQAGCVTPARAPGEGLGWRVTGRRWCHGS
jgi:hypothetical protein